MYHGNVVELRFKIQVEFSGNIYGMVSSAGYLCIVSLEICSKRITM